MSLDIVYHSGRYAAEPVVKKNPFTGEAVSVCPPEPLTANEVKSLLQVLKQSGASGPDDEGCYVVESEDGGVAEVFADNLKEGCMVTIRGLTPALSQFLFDFLNAGNLLMIPAMEEDLVLTTSAKSLQHVPKSLGTIVECRSAEEVSIALAEGVKAWQKFRDQVVRKK